MIRFSTNISKKAGLNFSTGIRLKVGPQQKPSQTEGCRCERALALPAPNPITLPRGNDVSQLRRVRCNFDHDGFKVEVLLLRVDGVRAGRYVLQAE